MDDGNLFHPLVSSARTVPSERAIGWLLAVVLAMALALRVWLALVMPPYFDDRYVINNLLNFLDGSLRPKHVFYGSLSFLPQALFLSLCDFLYSVTGIEALAVRGPQIEGITLGAFRIARMFVVVYGVLSILMIYRVGLRLFSPTVGLAAAAVLAAYPRHIKSSIQLKPDMLALLFTLVALYWAAEAARNPRLSRFLLAGVGVGLATSAKYTGAASALPLTGWALWTGFQDRRRWGWLVLAGVAAVATFFLLNPFAGMVFHYVPRLVHGYAAHARRDESDNLTVLFGEVKFVATEHGWVLGACLVLGTVLLVRQLWRRSEDREWTAALLLLSLYLGYPAIHAAGMTLFRRQNLMPAMAGAALVCAYGAVRCGHILLRDRSRRWGYTAALLLGGLLLFRPFADVYQQAVPNTWKVVNQTVQLRLAPLGTRHVAYEPVSPMRLSDGGQRAVVTAVPSLAELSPSALDLTDAEVFPLSRTRGPDAAFYQDRLRRLSPEGRLEIRARPFLSRGAPFVLLLHPWTPAGDSIPLNLERSAGSPRLLAARLPAQLSPGDVLSIELIRPARELSTAAVRLRPGGSSIPFYSAGSSLRQVRVLTPRFRYAAGVSEVQVRASVLADPKRFRLRLWRWTQAPRPPEG
jgi:hypothetical protein